jgi:hypothetical protein
MAEAIQEASGLSPHHVGDRHMMIHRDLCATTTLGSATHMGGTAELAETRTDQIEHGQAKGVANL